MKNSELRQKIRDYEGVYRSVLEPGLPIIIRVDGRAFHSLTRGLERPWDERFMGAMDSAALALAEEVSGAVLTYVQSDEVTVVVVPYAKENSQPWFGGGVQKICSISACIATNAFNAKMRRIGYEVEGMFDSRVFTVPRDEVHLVLIDRQKDCIRNSILSLSQMVFGKKAIHGKDTGMLQEELREVGKPWERNAHRYRFGRMAVKVPRKVKIPEEWRKKDGPEYVDRMLFELKDAWLFKDSIEQIEEMVAPS